LGETALKAIDFVPLSGRKVLCVVVSTSGFVDNKVIEVEEEVSREDLQRSANYLTESFSGLSLRDIRERLLLLMSEEKAQMDRALAVALQLARSGLDLDQGPGVLVDGATSLLSQPELGDISRVRRMFDTFANKARLVRMLNQCIQGRGVRVLIGEDSALTSELDFSLVATTYGVAEGQWGTLGIFGPSRMEYQKVIPLVHYLGETLSRALAESFDGQPDRK
jgi:heat-inducible transcriptional repressor